MNIVEYAKFKKMFGGGGSSGGDAVLIEKTVTENKTYKASADGADGYSKVTVNVPNVIPDGYIKPSGTKSITENGTHDVTEYASVSVNVAASGDGDTLTEFLKVRGFDYLFYNCSTFAEVPRINTSGATSMNSMFYGCKALTTVPLFDTSNVTDMTSMFNSCSNLTTVPLFDTSNVTDMTSMFYSCSNLTIVPLFNISNVTDMTSMFNSCSNLTIVPLFDTSKVTNMNSAFRSCTALTTVPALDMRNVSSVSNMFYSSKALTEIWVKNIKNNLQVSDGTSYGHLLTVDSLVHLVYELMKQSSTKTLTVGTANLAKLADVYVKAIDITDEMRAEDDLVNQKYPFVRCESTDEGAMLITDYASTIKNWTIK